MSKKELYNNLSEEVKKKLGECRTQEEFRTVLEDVGVEPLDDDLLNDVAGGWGGHYGGGMQTPLPSCESYQEYYV